MNEPNEAMKAMARRIGKTVCERNGLKLEYALAYEAALAAIMETQEACAKLADVVVSDCEQFPNVTERRASGEWARRIATAIRTGEHYALAGERHG